MIYITGGNTEYITGIFRFDPKQLKNIMVTEIELRPDLAIVGTDIKVCAHTKCSRLPSN